MKKLYVTTNFKQLFSITAGLVLSFLIYSITFVGFKESIYTFTIFSTLSFLFLYSKNQKKYERTITNIVFGILLFVIIKLLYQLSLTYFTVPEWDFPGFYLFGKVGISGLPFYDPNSFFKIYNHLNLANNVAPGFVSEVVEVGFWYPPPSMFLFLPLGIFKLQTAYIIWQTMLIIFLVISILLLLKYYTFKPSEGYNEKIFKFFLLSLILFFPSFLSSFEISQTVFIFLFLLLLLLKDLDNWKAGIFLALLIIIKPLAAIFALYFLIFKKWKIFTSFVVTGCLIIGLSILFFGFDSFLTFFKYPPTDRIPPEVFYESTIQSLSAVLLRLQLKYFGYVRFSSIKIIAYTVSFFILLITIYCSFLISKKDSKLAFMIFVPMALIIYPNTLTSYTIILLPIILYIFNKNYLNSTILNVLSIFVLYSICHYSFFLFNLILWILFVAWSVRNRYKLFPEIKFTN